MYFVLDKKKKKKLRLYLVPGNREENEKERKKWGKIKNGFKVNKLFLYIILNLIFI